MLTIATVLENLPEFWSSRGEEERPLREVDFRYVGAALAESCTQENSLEAFKEFGEQFSLLQRCIADASFSPLGDSELAQRFQISPNVCDDVLNEALLEAIHADGFVNGLFLSLETLVEPYYETFETPFGSTEVPTDNSITTALANLPTGFDEIFYRLQYKIAEDSYEQLLDAVFSSKDGFGPPGTSLRLIIDCIESQFFNKDAIDSMLVLTEVSDEGETIADHLFDLLLPRLGPLPNNLAFGPIFTHLFFFDAVNDQFNLLESFLAHCNGKNGFKGGKVHAMGLKTVLGFIFQAGATPMNNRYRNLFCRSQFENETVANHLSVPMLKKIVSLLCIPRAYDDFTMITIGYMSSVFQKHGTAVIETKHLKRIREHLLKDPEGMKELLDESCYDELLRTVTNLLGQ